jgi:hypothetical protein
VSLSLLVLTTAAAAAQTAPVAPAKPTPHASGQATIYVMRPSSVVGAIWGKLGSPGIKVDGNTVGVLTPGTYIVTSRPAGHHTLIIDATISANWESPVDLAAGQTYYIEIGPYSGAIGQQAVNMLMANTQGQLMPGHSWNPGFCFFALDATHGRAALAGLTNVTQH